MIKADRRDILVTNEGEFRVSDVVTLEVGIMPYTYFKTGKIINIQTSSLTLDCSEKYDSDTKKFNYDEIWHIKKLDN